MSNHENSRAERAAYIAALGMKPEPHGIGPFHPDAYAASTGELRAWAAETSQDRAEEEGGK